MSCIQVDTLDEAMRDIPSSVLPITGLRRDADGALTKDALSMIVDGLKSRGIDPTDKGENDRIRSELIVFLCSLNNQYQFLISELLKKTSQNNVVTKDFLRVVKNKNQTMQDVINTSGYLQGIKSFGRDTDFIEGWQNTQSTLTSPETSTIEGLQNDMNALESKTYESLKRHMVEVTEEKIFLTFKNSTSSFSVGAVFSNVLLFCCLITIF
jgi:hypothetical protein